HLNAELGASIKGIVVNLVVPSAAPESQPHQVAANIVVMYGIPFAGIQSDSYQAVVVAAIVGNHAVVTVQVQEQTGLGIVCREVVKKLCVVATLGSDYPVKLTSRI